MSPVSRWGMGRLDTLAGDATSQEWYRTLFETMPQGVVYYDAAESTIGANPAASEILGLDAAGVASWPIVRQANSVREDGSPFPVGGLPVQVALTAGTTWRPAALTGGRSPRRSGATLTTRP
jgi:PAS domain-containing protein